MKPFVPFIIYLLCKKFLQPTLKGSFPPIGPHEPLDGPACAFMFNRVFPVGSICGVANATSNETRFLLRNTTQDQLIRRAKLTRNALDCSVFELGVDHPYSQGGDELLLFGYGGDVYGLGHGALRLRGFVDDPGEQLGHHRLGVRRDWERKA